MKYQGFHGKNSNHSDNNCIRIDYWAIMVVFQKYRRISCRGYSWIRK